MREILFRGKCGYNNEWVEGFYYRAKLYRSDKELCHYITIPHPESDGQPSDHIMVHPETVGQFTGRKMKDKRVFDGDIIFARHSRLLVGYDTDYLAWWTYYFDEAGNPCRFCPLHDIATWETSGVIGNIHDNPELLENP